MTLSNFLSWSIQLVSVFSQSSLFEVAILGVFALGVLIALIHVISVIVRLN